MSISIKLHRAGRHEPLCNPSILLLDGDSENRVSVFIHAEQLRKSTLTQENRVPPSLFRGFYRWHLRQLLSTHSDVYLEGMDLRK
jgi:hypothetical protein